MKEFREDEIRHQQDLIQKETDSNIHKMDELFIAKEKEILTV